jgi:hypothetical protein
MAGSRAVSTRKILPELRSGRGTAARSAVVEGRSPNRFRSRQCPSTSIATACVACRLHSPSGAGEEYLSYVPDLCQRSLMLTPTRMLRQPCQCLNIDNIREAA